MSDLDLRPWWVNSDPDHPIHESDRQAAMRKSIEDARAFLAGQSIPVPEEIAAETDGAPPEEPPAEPAPEAAPDEAAP